MRRVVAPYNFVPANTAVVFPYEPFHVTQDIPFREGICGHLDLRVEPQTPLFVRGTHDPSRFFQLPDGTRAIPGSTIRGMLRAVFEIASFGKISRVNDHRYSVRDLSNRDLYTKHMAEIGMGTRRPVPLVEAAWLTESQTETYDGAGEDGSPRWILQPCHFAKVDYVHLEALAPGFRPGRKQAAPEKYRAWRKRFERRLSLRDTLRQSARIEKLVARGVRSRSGIPRIGDFGIVTALGPEEQTSGHLVFTGQPNDSRRRGGKHHDFFFFDAGLDPVPVPFGVKRDFEFVHRDTGQQHRLELRPNDEWALHKESLENGEPVPIFYLHNGRGSPTAMGLAMMFRLPYRFSTRDAVANAQAQAFSDLPDLADLVFGRVPEGAGAGHALRGRVAVETACEVEVDGRRGVELPMVRAALGTPKPSYYPSYLEQPERLRSPADYRTYMDKGAKARGTKRYAQRERPVDPDPPIGKFTSEFHPVAGAVFRSRIHVHNLRPFELGALLWSIDFGNDEKCRHGLGMAKPLGYGSVALRIEGTALQNSIGERVDQLEPIREAFEDYMEKKAPGWSHSPQLVALRALSTPVPAAEDENLRYMTIAEHQQAKRALLSLPLAVDRRMPAARATARNNPRPAPTADSAATRPQSPEEAAEQLLQRALLNHQHLPLLREWMADETDLADLYREVARRQIGKPQKQWRKRNADLWDWLWGSR